LCGIFVVARLVLSKREALFLNKTKMICISGMVMAMYIALMFATQGFAFGMYQIRIATALYSLSYIFPFLIVPLALANAIANSAGPMGMLDIIGGFIIGIITSGAVYLIRRFGLPLLLIIPVIIFFPAFIVPIWLSHVLNIPYFALVIKLTIGQTIPAIVGYLLVKALRNPVERMKMNGQN